MSPAPGSPTPGSPSTPESAASGDTAPAQPESEPAETAANTEVDRSQRARLRGRVLTYGEREPLGGASLVFSNGRPPVVTSDDGSFSVFLPPGKHEITIRAQGFDELSGNVELSPKQDLEVEYRMDRSLDAPVYRTVVKHERQVAVSSTTLRDVEMCNVAGSRGDPLRVVSSLPGAGQLAGFLPYVVVRGSAPGNTGYYLDGSRVPALFHVAIGPSVIHPYFIDEVDFYPGGAPVRLGRYAGGIIEGRTKPARRDRLHGDVAISLTDASMLLEVPLNRPKLDKSCEGKRRDCKRGPAKGALTLAGRYSYTAAILSAAQANAKIQYWDYQARFDHALGRKLRYTAFAYGSFDNLGLKEDTDPETGETFEPPPILRLQFHRFDNRIRQRLRGGGSATYAVVLGLDQTGLTSLGTNAWRIAPRANFAVPVKDNVKLRFGVDQEVQIFRLAESLDDLSDIGGVEDLALLFSDRTVTRERCLLRRRGREEQRAGPTGRSRGSLHPIGLFSPYLPNAQRCHQCDRRGPAHPDPREKMQQEVGAEASPLGVYHQPPSCPDPDPRHRELRLRARSAAQHSKASFGYEWRVLPDQRAAIRAGGVSSAVSATCRTTSSGDSEFEVEELEDIISQVNGWTYGLETLVKLEPGQQHVRLARVHAVAFDPRVCHRWIGAFELGPAPHH